MEMKIKSQVQFNDDLSQRSNIVSGDSLSNSFAKIHHDLNDYEIAANIAANDRPKNLLYIHDILSDSVSTATEEILGYPLDAGTYVYSAEIYTVQNPSVANVTKIEFLGADGNTVVGTCNIACDTKKEEHINVTLSDEAYYIKYYRDTYSSETVGYLKTSKQMICLPNVYAAFPEYTMYAPSLGETFLEVEDSVKTYDVQDTYDSSSYKAISGKGVYSALESLSVSSTGGAGKYISEISEIGGKIEATPMTFDTALSSSGTNNNAPTTKAVYDDQQRQDALEAEDRAALIEQIDNGAKNLLNLNTDFATATSRGITYKNNKDGTINVSGTSSAGDSYINLYDRNTDNLFGIQKGETVVIRSTSDSVSINLIYKKSNGNYGLTVYGYKSSPGRFTVPSDFVGFLLRVGVPKTGTTVNEDVGGMICTAADYAVSPEVVLYALPNPVITPALIEQVDSGAKNLLRNTAVTTTAANGLTYTVNADKSVTVTGNASAYYAFTIAGSRTYANAMPLKRGTYIIKAGIAFDSSKPIFIQFGVMTSSGASISWQNIYDTNKELVVNNDTTRIVYELYNPSGSYSGYNATFYPMICTAADYAVSPKFVPYLEPYSEIGRLGYHIETVVLNSVTITKSGNGIFYTHAIDASDKFDLLLGATLNNFGNLQSNIAIMPAIKPTDKTYSLWICDSTNPQTLPVLADSQVKVVLYGILKGQ